LSDPTFQAGINAFGVPLNASELNEMALRGTLEDAMSTIEDYGASHASTYAGTYIDQPGGGYVYVGFTSAAGTRLPNGAEQLQDAR
jgi:hypothetical protein